MPSNTDALNQSLEEYRAYLETLTIIQVDPRLRSRFGFSDVVQNTLVEAWQEFERIGGLHEADRKRWLRRMLVNNLLQEIEKHRAGRRDVRRERAVETAAEESSSRLQSWLAGEDKSPSENLMAQDRSLQLLEALSQLNTRQREALILQKYHGWTLAQIAEHLGCTTGVVAGLHARGLEKLRQLLPSME